MKHNSIVKSLILVIAIGVIGALQSCTKGLSSLHFNLGMQTQTVTVTIPATSSDTVAIGPVTTSYNVDSFIRAQTGNQLGISNINSVKLASVVLTLTNSTSANNFANFQSCTASFTSNTDATPYTLNISNNPDAASSTLSLPVNLNDELKNYIGTQFSYNLSGILRRPVTAPLTCTITFSYNLIVQG
jgi:hypothetical protein